MSRLANRAGLVTGAGQGIGEAILRRFVAEGASVLALDRSEDRLAPLCRELGSCAVPCIADNTDHAALERAVVEARRRFGRIDFLVNNAGIQLTRPLCDMSMDDVRRQFEVNFEGHVVLTRAVAGHMKEAGYGRIVNIASTQAISVEANVAAYAATKAALLSLTRSLAVELAPHGICANAIAPGAIRTPLCVVNGVNELETPDFYEWYVRRRKIPLARAGEPREVASAALFLASEEASYVTGATLVVDGGLTITF